MAKHNSYPKHNPKHHKRSPKHLDSLTSSYETTPNQSILPKRTQIQISLNLPRFEAAPHDHIAYLSWLEAIEVYFKFHCIISDREKFKFATCAFSENLAFWLECWQRERWFYGEPLVTSWTELKARLDLEFLPSSLKPKTPLKEPNQTEPCGEMLCGLNEGGIVSVSIEEENTLNEVQPELHIPTHEEKFMALGLVSFKEDDAPTPFFPELDLCASLEDENDAELMSVECGSSLSEDVTEIEFPKETQFEEEVVAALEEGDLFSPILMNLRQHHQLLPHSCSYMLSCLITTQNSLASHVGNSIKNRVLCATPMGLFPKGWILSVCVTYDDMAACCVLKTQCIVWNLNEINTHLSLNASCPNFGQLGHELCTILKPHCSEIFKPNSAPEVCYFELKPSHLAEVFMVRTQVNLFPCICKLRFTESGEVIPLSLLMFWEILAADFHCLLWGYYLRKDMGSLDTQRRVNWHNKEQQRSNVILVDVAKIELKFSNCCLELKSTVAKFIYEFFKELVVASYLCSREWRIAWGEPLDLGVHGNLLLIKAEMSQECKFLGNLIVGDPLEHSFLPSQASPYASPIELYIRAKLTPTLERVMLDDMIVSHKNGLVLSIERNTVTCSRKFYVVSKHEVKSSYGSKIQHGYVNGALIVMYSFLFDPPFKEPHFRGGGNDTGVSNEEHELNGVLLILDHNTFKYRVKHYTSLLCWGYFLLMALWCILWCLKPLRDWFQGFVFDPGGIQSGAHEIKASLRV